MLRTFITRPPIAVSLGAIAGALCRYYLDAGFAAWLNTRLPVSTLIINVSGCLLMGCLVTLATQRLTIRPDMMLVLTTGFLGAYTTFSSYELETVELIQARPLADELWYWLGSPVLGLLGFYLGRWLGRSLPTMQ
jgi:CrcB protein